MSVYKRVIWGMLASFASWPPHHQTVVFLEGIGGLWASKMMQIRGQGFHMCTVPLWRRLMFVGGSGPAEPVRSICMQFCNEDVKGRAFVWIGTWNVWIWNSLFDGLLLDTLCSSPPRIQENNASLEHGSTQDDFLLSPPYDRGRLRHQTVPKMDAWHFWLTFAVIWEISTEIFWRFSVDIRFFQNFRQPFSFSTPEVDTTPSMPLEDFDVLGSPRNILLNWSCKYFPCE